MVDFSAKKRLNNPLTRLFVQPDYFIEDKVIGSREEVHYIKNVLKGRVGDEIIVLDGKGKEYKGEIEELAKKRVKIKLKEEKKEDTESFYEITLAQGLCKKENLELIIQKTTELGVTAIQPFYSENSVIKYKSENELNKKILRWEKIAKNAAEQSSRKLIPEIKRPVEFKEMLEEYLSTGEKIIFYEGENNKFFYDYFKDNILEDDSVVITVGPEGGFSKGEIESALEYNFTPVGLGPRILRTETAAIVVTALTFYQLGELGGKNL